MNNTDFQTGSFKKWSGTFFDGESAVEHKVEVKFSDGNVIINFIDSSRTIIWEYPKIQAVSGPIRVGSHCLITYSDTPYARLSVRDVDFAEQLLHQSTHLTAKSRHKKFILIATICTAIAVCFIFTVCLGLKYAPSAIARNIPEEWRASLGKNVEEMMVGDNKKCVSPAGLAAFTKIVRKLKGSDPRLSNLNVNVYNMKIINAFAAPGSRIIISGELIKFAETPEEVAGVIAHEMGHVIELDATSQLVRYYGISIVQSLIFGGSSGLGELAGNIGAFATLTRFSREAEGQADDHALRILRVVAADPKGLGAFFARLIKKYNLEDSEGGIMSIMSTHPDTSDRVEKVQRQEKYSYQPIVSADEWADLQQICSQTASQTASQNK